MSCILQLQGCAGKLCISGPIQIIGGYCLTHLTGYGERAKITNIRNFIVNCIWQIVW